MHVHSVASGAISNSTDKQPPAQAARAALKDQPDLAIQPFGKLVSEFARNLGPSVAGETA
jgi:hypothetical protein